MAIISHSNPLRIMYKHRVWELHVPMDRDQQITRRKYKVHLLLILVVWYCCCSLWRRGGWGWGESRFFVNNGGVGGGYAICWNSEEEEEQECLARTNQGTTNASTTAMVRGRLQTESWDNCRWTAEKPKTPIIWCGGRTHTVHHKRAQFMGGKDHQGRPFQHHQGARISPRGSTCIWSI